MPAAAGAAGGSPRYLLSRPLIDQTLGVFAPDDEAVALSGERGLERA